MHNPPDRLRQDIQQFTHAIRHQGAATNKLNIARYRGFIIDNISNVISHTFPLFSFSLGDKNKESLVLAFLNSHPSMEPEFHNIATEFVRFMQNHNETSHILLSLLEFEWVIFSTEITPLIANHSDAMPELDNLKDRDVDIILNPTLQCVDVPFSINQMTVGFCPLIPGRFSYGIFRNKKHQVLWQALTLIDRFLMGYLDHDIPTSYATLKKQIEKHLQNLDLNTWLMHSHNSNLINISHKEKCHD